LKKAEKSRFSKDLDAFVEKDNALTATRQS
jgi:hypothetical protein